jgi:hypothetical protein
MTVHEAEECVRFAENLEIRELQIEDGDAVSLEVFKKTGYEDFSATHSLTKREYPDILDPGAQQESRR